MVNNYGFIKRFIFEGKHNRSGGFSLIEMALALMLIGVVTAGLLNQYNTYIKKKQHEDTKNVLFDIDRALQDYVTTYGYYPCPADQSVPYGDPDYGASVNNCIHPSAVPPCHGLGQGICRTTGGPVVLIGGVPFKELHMGGEVAYDGWKNRITYAVSRILAPTSPIITPLPNGIITVEQTDSVGTVINNAQYVLVAPGSKGAGGFNKNGTISRPCNLSQREGENCDQDNVFAANPNRRWRNDVEGPNYFDDYVSYREVPDTPDWSVEAATPDDLRFRYDRVGIGVTDADPRTDLHVAGDIKVDDWAKAATICNGDANPATAECFDPEAIAGSKTDMRCDAANSLYENQAMIGVAKQKVKCKLTVQPTAATPAPCPTGYLAVGFLANGALDCQIF